MARAHVRRAFARALAGETLAFDDFETLLRALGFRLDRQKGSHRIYTHPRLSTPFPVQSDGHDAKRYQVRQLRDMIRRYGLALTDDTR